MCEDRRNYYKWLRNENHSEYSDFGRLQMIYYWIRTRRKAILCDEQASVFITNWPPFQFRLTGRFTKADSLGPIQWSLMHDQRIGGWIYNYLKESDLLSADTLNFRVDGEWNASECIPDRWLHCTECIDGIFTLFNAVCSALFSVLPGKCRHRIEIISKWLAINYRTPLMLLPKWFRRFVEVRWGSLKGVEESCRRTLLEYLAEDAGAYLFFLSFYSSHCHSLQLELVWSHQDAKIVSSGSK